MEDDQLPTRISPQALSKPQRSSAEETKRISATLSRLALHYWRPDFTPAQANLLLGDYLEDLRGKTALEVESACREYRLGHENKFFPRSAQLLEIIETQRISPEEIEANKDRADRLFHRGRYAIRYE